MELNLDAIQLVWRLVPAVIVVLTVMVRLAHESRQHGGLAKNPVSYSTHKN
jgi:hypothetical protein